MAAFIIVTALLAVAVTGAVILFLSPPPEDDNDFYFDIGGCENCERYSKEECRRCIHNRFNR